MSMSLKIVLGTTMLTMLGPGKALRGPDGSMHSAVDGAAHTTPRVAHPSRHTQPIRRQRPHRPVSCPFRTRARTGHDARRHAGRVHRGGDDVPRHDLDVHDVRVRVCVHARDRHDARRLGAHVARPVHHVSADVSSV
eukprot:3368287-Prymnesium_polylepis.1